MRAVDETTAPFESLAFTGEGKFEVPDFRLASALKTGCESSAASMELHRSIARKELQAMEADTILTGRQILWVVLQTFKTNANMGVVCGFAHIQNVKWQGDAWRQVEAFKNEWLEVISRQKYPSDQRIMAEMLLKAIEGSGMLKNDLYDYRRKVFDTGKPDYEAL